MKTSAIKKTFTKSQIITELAESTNLNKKDVPAKPASTKLKIIPLKALKDKAT